MTIKDLAVPLYRIIVTYRLVCRRNICALLLAALAHGGCQKAA
jgi:hypothetical protein